MSRKLGMTLMFSCSVILALCSAFQFSQGRVGLAIVALLSCVASIVVFFMHASRKGVAK